MQYFEGLKKSKVDPYPSVNSVPICLQLMSSNNIGITASSDNLFTVVDDDLYRFDMNFVDDMKIVEADVESVFVYKKKIEIGKYLEREEGRFDGKFKHAIDYYQSYHDIIQSYHESDARKQIFKKNRKK